MDGIWQKLKNHPYFKVVAAYLAGGWVLLQIAEILSPALRLPDWVLSAIAVTLIAGFPVVLIIAWIMAKPAVAARGEKLFLDGKYVDYGIAAIAGVLCLFVSFRWFFSETVSTAEVVAPMAVEAPAAVSSSAVAPPSQAPEMSIAVLPFRDMSPNADQAYFSDGVAEEIIFSLARLDELNVTARSSSFAFKDQNMDLKEIARRLGVRYILDGSVRKQDERVRISVQLIDIRNEFSIWSDIFDEELNDIFAVQERISLAVVDNLQLVLGAEDKVRLADRGTRDGDSYEALLQARYIRASSDPAALPDAIDLLNQIVEQDPDFADAWAELGFANWQRYAYGGDLGRELDLAEIQALRALVLDPAQAQAHLVMGLVAAQRRNYVAMRTHLDNALKHSPNDSLALSWYGYGLLSVGMVTASLDYSRRAVDLDPVQPRNYLAHATGLVAAGRYDEAEIYAQQAIDLGFFPARMALADVHAARDETQQAIEMARPVVQALAQILSADEIDTIVQGVFGGDQRAAAVTHIRELASQPDSASQILFPNFLVLLDEPELAFKVFTEKSYAFDFPFFVALWGENGAVSRRHPAFQSFANEIGLVDYWQAHNWPEYCQPTTSSAETSEDLVQFKCT